MNQLRFQNLPKVAALSVALLSHSGTLFAAAVPFVPSPAGVAITVTNIGGSVRARVSVTLPTPCHEVGSWGNPARTASTISADAQFWVDPAVACIQIIWEEHTEYDLGPLPPGAYQFVFRAWGQSLAAKAFTVSSPASVQGFYRIAAQAASWIASLDRRGLLICTSAVPNTTLAIEAAPQLSGPWMADVSYTVVANANDQLVALVPLGPPWSPPPACCRNEIVERIRPTILIGAGTCRVDAYVWRDLMPGPGPSTGVLASVLISASGGQPAPEGATITGIWLINGSAVWEAPPPFEPSPIAPGALSTTVRNGPLWPAGTTVDVVVQISLGKVSYLLRAANETIEAVF